MTGSLLLAGEDTNKAGPIGLLVLVVLGIACYWLFRSMSKHLRRVPANFGVEPAAPPARPAPEPDAGGPVAAPAASVLDPVDPPAP